MSDVDELAAKIKKETAEISRSVNGTESAKSVSRSVKEIDCLVDEFASEVHE